MSCRFSLGLLSEAQSRSASLADPNDQTLRQEIRETLNKVRWEIIIETKAIGLSISALVSGAAPILRGQCIDMPLIGSDALPWHASVGNRHVA